MSDSPLDKVVVRVKEGHELDSVVPLEGGIWGRRNIGRAHGPFETRRAVLTAFPHVLELVTGATPGFSIIPPNTDEAAIASTSPPADDVALTKPAEEAEETEEAEGKPA